MDINDLKKTYPSNSQNQKKKETLEEPPKDEKKHQPAAVTAKMKKASMASKIFSSDDAQTLKQYAVHDVLLPTIRKAIYDIITNGISMLLYPGGTQDRNRYSGGGYGGYGYNAYPHYNYSAASRPSTPRPDPRYQDQQMVSRNYELLRYENRKDAEEVLDRMTDLIDLYGVVSVGDLFDISGVTGQYTDNKFGWTDLKMAYPVLLGDGYALKLPRPYPV